jgi:hypothetical protein
MATSVSSQSATVLLPSGAQVPTKELERVKTAFSSAKQEDRRIVADCVQQIFQNLSLDQYKTLQRLKLTSSDPTQYAHIKNILSEIVVTRGTLYGSMKWITVSPLQSAIQFPAGSAWKKL